MMLAQFRIRYPQGSLISELVTIDRGQYIVRVLAQIEGITLGTGLGAAYILEEAEDRARNRALETLYLKNPSFEASETLPDEAQKAPPTEISRPVDLPDDFPPHQKEPDLSQDLNNSDPLEKPSSPKKSPRQTGKKNASPAMIPQEEDIKDKVSSPPKSSENRDLEVIPNEKVSLSDPISDTPLIESPLFTPETVQDNTPEPLSPVESQPSPEEEGTLDFSDIIARSNAELKRLGWKTEQGRDYLLQTYGKRSRQVLSDEELLEFLHYLESLPTPS